MPQFVQFILEGKTMKRSVLCLTSVISLFSNLASAHLRSFYPKEDLRKNLQSAPTSFCGIAEHLHSILLEDSQPDTLDDLGFFTFFDFQVYNAWKRMPFFPEPKEICGNGSLVRQHYNKFLSESYKELILMPKPRINSSVFEEKAPPSYDEATRNW